MGKIGDRYFVTGSNKNKDEEYELALLPHCKCHFL
jgi:hypothetical protein